MNLLFDTNILVFLTKTPYYQKVRNSLNPDNQRVYISIVTIAELRSISLQNKWGVKKINVVNELLEGITVIEVNENLANIYAEIDAYSQCRNPSYTVYPFKTPRNMGKNDVWIAATASLIGLKLVTTDADFNHLNNVFIDVHKVDPIIFKR